jgi:hypothetical protein
MPRVAITVHEASTETPPVYFSRYFQSDQADACHLILGFDADNPKNQTTVLAQWIEAIGSLVIDHLDRFPRTLATTVFLVADATLHPRLLFDDPLKDALNVGAIFRPRVKEFYPEERSLADSLRTDLVFHGAIPPDALIDSEDEVSLPPPGHQSVSVEMQEARLRAYCHPPYVVPASIPQDAVEAVLGGDVRGIRLEEIFPVVRTQHAIPTLNVGDRVVFRMRPQSGHKEVLGMFLGVEGLKGRETFLVRKGSELFQLKRWLIESVEVRESGSSSRAQKAVQAELHQ